MCEYKVTPPTKSQECHMNKHLCKIFLKLLVHLPIFPISFAAQTALAVDDFGKTGTPIYFPQAGVVRVNGAVFEVNPLRAKNKKMVKSTRSISSNPDNSLPDKWVVSPNAINLRRSYSEGSARSF